MVTSDAAGRMAENEMVFREYNERVQRGFDELAQLARQEGKHHLTYEDDMPLHFYCECSDENCNVRIMLKPSVYAQIHKQRDRFVVIKNHGVPEVERIVHSGSDYSIVEKIMKLPKTSSGLHSTDINNSQLSSEQV